MNKVPFPTVTIATVTYNAEKTLPCTLESVASQTFPHIEHLIIDGCSKDQTMELIHRYVDANTGKTCPHDIRVVREPDKGLYDAMNKGIALATGDYLCFLNAGDSFHEDDTLQKMVHSINGNELPLHPLRRNGLGGRTRTLHPPPPSASTETTDLEKVPTRHVGLPPIVLCTNGFGPTGTLRPELSLFCRLRLVHTFVETGGTSQTTDI